MGDVFIELILEVVKVSITVTMMLINAAIQVAPNLYRFFRKRPILFLVTCLIILIFWAIDRSLR